SATAPASRTADLRNFSRASAHPIAASKSTKRDDYVGIAARADCADTPCSAPSAHDSGTSTRRQCAEIRGTTGALKGSPPGLRSSPHARNLMQVKGGRLE